MSVSIEGLDGAAVTLAAGQGRADSSLKRLTVGGQPFFLLKQRGRFPDIAYDHARLLAPEVENGAFPEIIATIARGVNLESATLSKVRSEEHTSELQSLMRISYAVFCLKKKTTNQTVIMTLTSEHTTIEQISNLHS